MKFLFQVVSRTEFGYEYCFTGTSRSLLSYGSFLIDVNRRLFFCFCFFFAPVLCCFARAPQLTEEFEIRPSIARQQAKQRPKTNRLPPVRPVGGEAELSKSHHNRKTAKQQAATDSSSSSSSSSRSSSSTTTSRTSSSTEPALFH